MITKKEIAKIHKVIGRVSAVISGDAQGGMYARGLAAEGYNGGYRDALNDVLLFMNSGCLPNRNGWWDEPEEKKGKK